MSLLLLACGAVGAACAREGDKFCFHIRMLMISEVGADEFERSAHPDWMEACLTQYKAGRTFAESAGHGAAFWQMRSCVMASRTFSEMAACDPGLQVGRHRDVWAPGSTAGRLGASASDVPPPAAALVDSVRRKRFAGRTRGAMSWKVKAEGAIQAYGLPLRQLVQPVSATWSGTGAVEVQSIRFSAHTEAPSAHWPESRLSVVERVSSRQRSALLDSAALRVLDSCAR